MQIIIDEEFKSLLPALDRDTFAMLEENILENGCRDSLVLWNDILIDGHNRYEICTKHNIPFSTVNKEFESREEALIWIISTQVSRRNLTPIQLSHYRGLHYRADKKIKGVNNQYVQKSEKGQNDPFQEPTANRLSNQYRVSPKTIMRDAKIANAIDAIGEFSSDAKKMILSGEVKIDKKELEAISFLSGEELSEVAVEIEQGTYEKGMLSKTAIKTAEAGNGVSAGSGVAGIPQTRSTISGLVDELYSELRNLTINGGRTELKTALKVCIDMLNDLYSQV